MTARGYRPDIDGLRAVAVLSVVLFHAGVTGLGGGYVGVDIFFVISGYLISGNIALEAGRDSFSLARFYERRARRILPALVLVLGVTAMASFLFLLPAELESFGNSLIASVGSFSNFHFWRDSGYFAAPAETKPLLHTWSLSIEEQFYLLLPVPLSYLARRSKRLAAAALTAIALASFMLSVFGVARSPVATFYLLPTRAWELLLGGLVALGAFPEVRKRWLRECVASAGLALILTPVATYTSSTPFPGAGALFPCVGAAALIHTASTGPTIAARLLGLRPLVAIGLASYSLYLWHWPALVFARAYAIRSLEPSEVALVIAFCTGASALSWRYVERPFRRHDWLSTRSVFGYSAMAMALPVLVGVFFSNSKGLPSRLPSPARDLLVKQDTVTCAEYTAQSVGLHGPCFSSGVPMRATALLWGDSHAGALAVALEERARLRGARLVAAWSTACAPLLGIDRLDLPDARCAEKNQAVFRWLQQNPVSHVILAGRWALWSEGARYGEETGLPARLVSRHEGDPSDQRRLFVTGFQRTLSELQKLGIAATVVASVPEVGHQVPDALARIRWWKRNLEIRPTLAAYRKRQAFVTGVFRDLVREGHAKLVSPETVLCDSAYCQVEGAGRALYSDDDHLSYAGAKLLSGLFWPSLSAGADVGP